MTHCMVLDTHKVMKQFHGRPHQGKPMTWLPKKQVTVGVKWNLAEKDYVPDTDNWVYAGELPVTGGEKTCGD